MQELRLAIRALSATPIVSLVAVLSLALGIGANTAIFSLVHGVLLRTLPVPEPQRLVTVSSDFALTNGFKNGLGWNYAMWERFRQRVLPSGDTARHAFDGAFAWAWAEFDLAQSGEMQRARGVLVSGEFFRTLGVTPLLGRTFTAEDDVRGGGPEGPVAVISYGLWQRRFGGAANIIGTRLAIKRVPFTIVGVTPPGFFGIEVGESVDVMVPIGTDSLMNGARTFLDRTNALMLVVMLRLKPEQSIATATAAINAMQREVLADADENRPRWLKEPYVLVPAGTGSTDKSRLRQRFERPLLTLTVVVGLVLLIACANIANLLLARATARRHELSVRLALGASRWRLARHLLVESLVLAGAGAVVGLAFAVWASRALVAQLSTSGDPVFLDLPLEWPVLAFAVAAGLGTALLFGTVPAFRASRAAPIDAMKAQGRGASGDARLSVSSALVVAQVALSLVLVVAAGLFVRTFERLARAPLGFESERVLVVNVDSARTRVDAANRTALHERLAAAVATVPGVAHAAASISTPGSGAPNLLVNASGRTVDAERRVIWNVVTPAWFATYGIPVRAGREFIDRDTATAAKVVVVNDVFARRFFPGRSVVGVTLDARINDWLDGRTIVGVVGGAAYGSLRDPVSPAFYLPLSQSAGLGPPGATSVRISVRAAAGPPAHLARSVAAALTAIDGDLSFSFRPLADTIEASLAQERIVALLSGFFGVLAVLLAGLGLYGVTAYAVSRRRAEIGIRMALGADAGGVVRLVLARVLLLVGMGVIAGTAASLWLSRFVATLLYGLEPRDPLTVIGAASILVAVGALAGGLPARRAARIDPAIVLRQG